MKVEYDKYYQTEDLFGAPYPELIAFYTKLENQGRLLDLGCGQGRDAIPLARLGFVVTGVDNSKVGIDQLNRIARKESLPLIGTVADIYNYTDFDQFEHILLDSMFHFGKKDKAKEIDFLNQLFTRSKPKTVITICIQNTGKKLEILQEVIASREDLELVTSLELLYRYEDQESNHSSISKYEMVVVKKV